MRDALAVDVAQCLRRPASRAMSAAGSGPPERRTRTGQRLAAHVLGGRPGRVAVRIGAHDGRREGSLTLRAAVASRRNLARKCGRPAYSERITFSATCRPAALRALDEPGADRVAGELQPVPQAELCEQVGPVPLDGLDADDEEVGDLLRGVALGDELEDLLLAVGDRPCRAARRRLRARSR